MMPTPERLRYVTTEIAIDVLDHFADGDKSPLVAKALARWFPDASPQEMVALRTLAGEHLAFYAILLRRRAEVMLADGRMVAARLPE